nr:reverse transcriptase domain-containing protein [Tanacetum cinerariifolium]
MAEDVKLKIDSMMVMISVSVRFSGSCRTTKLTLKRIRDLFFVEDIRQKTSREYTNYLISAKDRYRAEGMTEGRKQHKNKSKSWKIGEIKDKEVNMTAGDSDDALVCCIENTVEDRIIDSGASFHATYCKEELDRFRLRSDKVRLADDKTLDIASVRDVSLKTSFGTSWTMKDVRYIGGLKRRLILVGRLDEEGYHVGFGDQQWKVTKGSLVVAHENKRGSMYMVEVYPERIGAITDGGLGKQKNLSFIMSEKTKKLQRLEQVHTEGYGPTLLHQSEDLITIILLSKTAARAANGIVMLKMVPETPLQFGVTERLSRTFRAESTGLRAEASKMLWTDSVSTTYLIYHIPYVLIGLRIPEEDWQGKDTSLAHLKVLGCDSFVKVKDLCGEAMKCTFIGSSSDEMRYDFQDTKSHQVIRSRDITFVDSIYGAKYATDSSSLTKPIQKSQVLLVDIPENLTENDSVVAKHGLSLENHVEPSDVHQVGDEREVEVLRSFNWPPSELITEDGVLPKIPCIKILLALRLIGAACSVCSAVQKELGVWEKCFLGSSGKFHGDLGMCLSIMDAPPSPNHVFNFPEAEFKEDHQEEPEEEFEEDPEEDPEEGPEEDPEAEAKDDVPPPATPLVGSPITPQPWSESSSNTEDIAPVIENEALEMPPIGSTYEVGERCKKKRKVDMEACSFEVREGKKRMDKMEQDLGDEMQFSNVVEHRVTDLENKKQEKDEEMVKVKKRLGTHEANYSLVLSDRDGWRKAFLNLQAWVFERLGRGAWDARPDIITELCTCIIDRIMLPKMMKRKAVNKMFKLMMTTEYCLEIEIQRMEEELWTLTLKEDDIEAYNNHFHELALMCPDLVPDEKKKIERRWEEHQRNHPNNKNNPNNRNRNRNNNNNTQYHQQNRRQETARAYVAAPAEGKTYAGNLPKYCRTRLPGTDENPLRNVTCYGCGEKGHLRHLFPKGRNQRNEGARTRAYVVVKNPQENLNVVTGTFLLNDHYASVLFDSGAERSFVSIEFTFFINISPVTLNTSYDIKLADRKIVSTNTVLRGCTLALFSHMFKIDLIPTRLGSFDVIIGIDWLSYHRVVIVCYEKIVRIPLLNGEILEIHGERPEKDPKSLSCIKADEVRIDDIRIVCKFPEVFLDDLTGLPPVRKIKFRIDLIPGALPVVKSPYRLAPSEMQELSNQLKEL